MIKEWNETSVKEAVQKQRDFFNNGQTLNVGWRIKQLKLLKKSIIVHQEEIIDALVQDLGRSRSEAYFCDVGTVILEINEVIHNLRRWARPETHFSGLVCFPSIITKVYKMPYGVSLIISPFNFPVLLSFGVLAAAIGGGNTAILKTSSKTPSCTKIMEKIIAETFPPEYIVLVDGGHDVADMCLSQKFDKIFYTGSTNVGKHVLKMASENLTSVALELGGENGNWCIIRKDANLRDAARKIAFFKLCNAGQVCININQIAVAKEVAGKFIELLKVEFARQIGANPLENSEYPKLINKAAWQKCADEADAYRERIVFGGFGTIENCKYSPTIIYPVTLEDNIVQHELFNPLVPIVSYADGEVDKLLSAISKREHGLALYLFTKDKRWAKRVMQTQQYGGGCINEVILQLMVKGAPFNGTGHSGMGAYHGEWGFREFTHPSTVLFGKAHFNLPLREHPYDGKKNQYKIKLLKMFEK